MGNLRLIDRAQCLEFNMQKFTKYPKCSTLYVGGEINL